MTTAWWLLILTITSVSVISGVVNDGTTHDHDDDHVGHDHTGHDHTGHDHKDPDEKTSDVLLCKPNEAVNNTASIKYQCTTDYDCNPIDEGTGLHRTDLKCCRVGRSLMCSEPIKQGRCPRVEQTGLCINNCGADGECPLGKKCCTNGCSKHCVDFLPCDAGDVSGAKCPTRCRYGLVMDEYACHICRCVQPCEKFVCAEGYTCKIEIHPCVRKWHERNHLGCEPSQGICTAIDAQCPLPGTEPYTVGGHQIECGRYDKCPSGFSCIEDPRSVVAVCCPVIKCDKHCPLGRLTKNGVELCECDEPCKEVMCDIGKICVVSPEVCAESPCAMLALCTACPKVVCNLTCTYGLGLDPHNCPMCRCFQPSIECSTVTQTCEDHCEKIHDDCEGGNCGVIDAFHCTRCVQCNQVVTGECLDISEHCSKRCPFGYQQDGRGCKTCHCEDHSSYCEPITHCNLDCIGGYAMKNSKCPLCLCQQDLDNCPIMADCISKTGCPQGYAKDATNCSICQCMNHIFECRAMHNCPLTCPNGYVLDGYGCPVCQCQCPSLADLHAQCPDHCYQYATLEGSGCRICTCEDPDDDDAPPMVEGDFTTPHQCLEAIDRGECKEHGDWSMRWFYEKSLNMCIDLLYWGCAGNGNRFDSMQQCLLVCEGVTPHN